MADNDGKILKALESIQTDVTGMKGDITGIKQSQAQTNTTLGQVKTAVETIQAGQDDIREQLATKADKADILTVGVKIDKLRKRVEGIEEDTGSTTRHKN